MYQCMSKRYVLETCGSRVVGIDLLDSAIWINVISRASTYLQSLDGHDFSGQEENFKKQTSNVTAKIKEVKNRRDKLITLFESNRITIGEFDERSLEIDKLLEDLNKKNQELKTQKANENKEEEKEKGPSRFI